MILQCLRNHMHICWNKYFEQIYCIRFLPSLKIRGESLQQELDRVGILGSGIFKWKDTFQTPFQKILLQHVNCMFKSTKTSLSNFNAAMAHYETCKDAIEHCYKRVLILEDDVRFLNDICLIADILESSPKTDVVLYDHICNNPIQNRSIANDDQHVINKYFRRFDSSCGWFGSAACYSLNSGALEAFIKQNEHCLMPGDELWNNYNISTLNSLTKSYCCPNLATTHIFGDAINVNNIKRDQGFALLQRELYHL